MFYSRFCEQTAAPCCGSAMAANSRCGVKAGMTLPWSNGQVEGQINRLKMLKTADVRRAGMELLSRRFLLVA